MARVGDHRRQRRPMTNEQFAALKAITPKSMDQRVAVALERIATALEKGKDAK